MLDAPFALAVSAGLLAAVNPCGFAMLPAYVSLLVTAEPGSASQPSWPRRLGRALALTGAMTLGFVAFFGVFGLLAAPAADWLATRLPWLTVVIGVVLLALGLWLLAGKELPSPIPKAASAPELRQRFWPMFAFGVSFAVASLGCTVGPFLAVVVASFTSTSSAAGVGLFVAYAAGMALVVGAVAVAVAAAQQSMLRWLRRTAHVISRVAGLLMALAGGYVAWYGWYEIRVFAGTTTTDPIIDTATQIQVWLAETTQNIGATGFLTAAAVLTAFTTAIVVWHNRRQQ